VDVESYDDHYQDNDFVNEAPLILDRFGFLFNVGTLVFFLISYSLASVAAIYPVNARRVKHYCLEQVNNSTKRSSSPYHISRISHTTHVKRLKVFTQKQLTFINTTNHIKAMVTNPLILLVENNQREAHK